MYYENVPESVASVRALTPPDLGKPTMPPGSNLTASGKGGVGISQLSRTTYLLAQKRHYRFFKHL